MDVLAVTDFPDIRCKTLIQSAHEGNIIIIPREGGYLTRLYIELDKLDRDERVASRNISLEQMIAAAIVGPNAGDLIAEVALAIEMGADAVDLGHTIHPHPTLSETVNFAAEMFEGTITDLIPPKKRH